jgi:2-methylcitrate dehydratase PrpD
MAQRGITGSKRSFEGPMGVFNLYQRGEYDPSELTVALGKEFRVTDFSYKPYPCCRCNHGSIDAALEIARQHNLDPDQIQEIRVGITEHDFESTADPIEVKRNPRSIVDAQFSVAYTVATALVKKKVDLTDFTEEVISDPAVLKVARTVTPYIEPELERKHGVKISASAMEIKTKGGEVYTTTVIIPKGHPDNQMTDEEFENKFRSCALTGIKGVSPEKVDRLIEMLSNLEQVDDIREVTKLFKLRG